MMSSANAAGKLGRKTSIGRRVLAFELAFRSAGMAGLRGRRRANSVRTRRRNKRNQNQPDRRSMSNQHRSLPVIFGGCFDAATTFAAAKANVTVLTDES